MTRVLLPSQCSPRLMTKKPNPGPLEAANCNGFIKAEVQPTLSALEHWGHITSGIQHWYLEGIAMGMIK